MLLKQKLLWMMKVVVLSCFGMSIVHDPLGEVQAPRTTRSGTWPKGVPGNDFLAMLLKSFFYQTIINSNIIFWKTCLVCILVASIGGVFLSSDIAHFCINGGDFKIVKCSRSEHRAAMRVVIKCNKEIVILHILGTKTVNDYFCLKRMLRRPTRCR